MTRLLRVALLAVLLAACGGTPSAPVEKPAPAPAHAADDGTCPVAIAGTSVSVEDAADGAALVFVTTGDVAEVRRRVPALAAMISVPAKASTVEIQGGAKLQFVVAGDQVGTLQSELRMHAQHLASGSCKMDHDMGSHDMASHDTASHDAPAPEPVPAAADPKADALAAERAAYDKAKPVFEKWCAKCHTQGAKNATAKKLDHFDMTTYPFGGHHSAKMGPTIKQVLGLAGKKATMPFDKKGAVQGDELTTIAAWADAWEAAEKAGAHGPHAEHEHEHEHGHH
jgi:hypothetical protein